MMNCAQFVDVEFRSVNDDVGEAANGRHAAALFANAFARRNDRWPSGCGRRVSLKRRMQDVVAGFDEDEGGGVFAG